MEIDGKKVLTEDDFSYDCAKVGDLVNASVVMNGMNCIPPATMRTGCAQIGEPYSHKEDPDTGKWRAIYHTFKCISGGFSKGVWEYCGKCFLGETIERWNQEREVST